MGKILNPFTVLQFPNADCRGGEDNLIGTCYTSQECSDFSGKKTSGCASGFGICCLFLADCGATISENKTHFRNPGFPNELNIIQDDSRKCLIYVDRFSTKRENRDGICQLRLDFERFSILAGSGSRDTESICRDTFRIRDLSGGNNRVPVICGENSRDHIYFDVDSVIAPIGVVATLEFNFGPFKGSRAFNIRVTQIECTSKTTSPIGCLQYFTGLTGRITTFNFNAVQPSSHLDKQQYKVCVRQALDYCCVEYSVCEDENSFTLDNTFYNLTQTLNNTFNPNDNGNDNSDQIVALATSSCTKDFIEIESSAEICYSPITYTRFCGFTLSTALGANTEEDARSGSDNTICDCSPPFGVSIRTSNEDTKGYTEAQLDTNSASGQKWDFEAEDIPARGLCLNYKQVRC